MYPPKKADEFVVQKRPVDDVQEDYWYGEDDEDLEEDMEDYVTTEEEEDEETSC